MIEKHDLSYSYLYKNLNGFNFMLFLVIVLSLHTHFDISNIFTFYANNYDVKVQMIFMVISILVNEDKLGFYEFYLLFII